MNVRDEKERWDSMRLVRLRRSNDEMFNNAMELYKMSFPAHEQRKPSSQAKIMGSKEYQFNLIYDEGQFVGILLCWEAEDFIYVEHFCIHPEMRNKRYGQRALELLNRQGKQLFWKSILRPTIFPFTGKAFTKGRGTRKMFMSISIRHIIKSTAGIAWW